jgi:hypothetical protein
MPLRFWGEKIPCIPYLRAIRPRVATLGTDHPERRALKGRQIERPNKVEAGPMANWKLMFAHQSVRDSSCSRISRPFKGEPFI